MYTTCSFCRAPTSFVGVGALSAPPWCGLSMLGNTAHVKTMSLTTFGLCSMVLSSTQNLLTNIPTVFSTTLCFWRSYSWIFFFSPVSCILLWSFTIHGIRAKESSPRNSENLVLPPPVVQVPEAPSSPFSLKMLLLKICASDEDPLDPTIIHRNLYAALIRARSTREKMPL